MHEPPHREPVFNVPAVVTVMLGVLIAVHIVRLGLSDASDQWLVLALAFIPDRYTAHAYPWPGGVVSAVASPLTHMLIHGDWAHLMLNGASLLAFGGLLARRLTPLRFLAFTAMTGLAGAGLFWLVNPSLASPMIGASGAIAGMMAAALRLLFSAVDGISPQRVGEVIRTTPRLIALKDLKATLADRRMQGATVLWLIINTLGAYGLATPSPGETIAWEAHIGGYVAGLLGLGLFDRPAAPVTHHDDGQGVDNSAVSPPDAPGS